MSLTNLFSLHVGMCKVEILRCSCRMAFHVHGFPWRDPMFQLQAPEVLRKASYWLLQRFFTFSEVSHHKDDALMKVDMQ